MPKSFTLFEFVVTMVLTSLVVLAAVTFEYTSNIFFEGANRRIIMMNEASLILEHMRSHALRAVGNNSDIPGGSGVIVGDYRQSLREAISELKNKVDFFILLSSESSSVNEDIARNFEEIKLIIASGESLTTSAVNDAL